MTIDRLLKEEFRRRVFTESIPRIEKCLEMLNDDEIWRRGNSSVVSVGNLVLHLCGNARQWICAALGGETDQRKRDEEFGEKGPIPKTLLVEKLRQLKQDIEPVIANLNAEDLERVYEVQVFQESGVSVLVHVIEHFSYHTGQITTLTKLMKDRDTGYYKGLAL